MTINVDQRQQALIERACARLVVQYAYLNDTRCFDRLALLFTEDASLFRPSAPEQAICGRAAILASFLKRPADIATFHTCSDILVDVEHSGAAHGRSRMVLWSAPRSAAGEILTAEARTPVPGVFSDNFVLTADGWKFARRRGSFWI